MLVFANQRSATCLVAFEITGLQILSGKDCSKTGLVEARFKVDNITNSI
jgi:hypothetical protein